jgi:hypothetical protein
MEGLLLACLSSENKVGVILFQKVGMQCHILRATSLQDRKQAEDSLKQLASQPAIIPELLAQMQSSPSVEVRQLAAVLLRKHISKHWKSLPAEVRRGGAGELFAFGFLSLAD